MEKFCPTCSRVFSKDATVCEDDGEPLVLIENEQSLVGSVLDGKFTLISKLGEGGMGSVYLARQGEAGLTEREVAIKVLKPEFSRTPLAIKRFLREARVVSKLGHPNTITVHDFGRSNDGLLYLVMERLMGRSLADVMDAEAPLEPERAVHIFSQICDSLQEAHSQGVTHRDLKPENIFIEQKIGRDDFVKVLDFGIAKSQEEEKDIKQATATGMICGTPSYMSPEQAMGRDLDGRSDIYALGVLLYEMLTMRKPYEGEAPMEVMLKHINEPVPDIYKATGIAVPVGLQRAIETLLAKRVDDRPTDCQVAKQLVIEGLNTPLVTEVAFEPQTPELVQHAAYGDGLSEALSSLAQETQAVPAKRQTGIWILALLLLIALAAVAWFAIRGNSKPIEVDRGGKEAELLADAQTRAAAILAKAEETAAQAEVVKAQAEAEAKAAEEAKALAAAQAAAAAKARAEAEAEAARLAAAANQASSANTIEEEAWVSLTVESDPPRAEIYEGEQLLGAAPLVLQRPRDSESVVLSVRSRGYRTQTIELSTQSDLTRKVELKRVQRGPRSDGTEGFGTF